MGNEASASSSGGPGHLLVKIFSHIVEQLVARRASEPAGSSAGASDASTAPLRSLLDEAWAIMAAISDRDPMSKLRVVGNCLDGSEPWGPTADFRFYHRTFSMKGG